MAPPPPELMEELVEEIVLRFPPDDPASLVCAALVCKPWCRFACGAAFRRRFREFHPTAAPMLGLLYVYDHCSEVREDDTPRNPDGWVPLVDIVLLVPIAYFVPTTSFRPVHASTGRYGWRAIDARHGRVLLCRMAGHGDLCVWDPITDEQQNLSQPPFYLQIAAVACAATDGGYCDHLDCSRGPFRVAVGIEYDGMRLSVYSSEAGAWSNVILCGDLTASSLFMDNNLPGVLVRSALYILVRSNHLNHEIVKYDLATQQASMIHLPPKFRRCKRSIMVMTDDDGNLGFVVNVKYKLELWSRVNSRDEDAGFALSRVIDLRKVRSLLAQS